MKLVVAFVELELGCDVEAQTGWPLGMQSGVPHQPTSVG